MKAEKAHATFEGQKKQKKKMKKKKRGGAYSMNGKYIGEDVYIPP